MVEAYARRKACHKRDETGKVSSEARHMEATERAISEPSDFHNKDALTQGYGQSLTTQDMEIGPEQVLVSHSDAHEE
jgi:hypothetical protein